MSPRGIRANVRALHGLTSDPCPALDALVAEHGPTFSVGGGPLTIAVVGDPAHLAMLLAMSTDNFRWGHRFNTLGFIVGPTSIIVSDGTEHRRRRLAVQPAFARRRLDAFVPLMVAETDRVVDELLRGAAGPNDLQVDSLVDLYEVGRKLVRRIVVRVLFGDDFGARADELGDILEPAMQYGVQPALRQLPHPLPYTRRARARAALRAADAVIYEEIARHQHAAPDNDTRGVLAELLGSDELSVQEVRDQIITLIAAGYDTTASGLAWTLLRAAGTPGVWARLRDEADSVYGWGGLEPVDGLGAGTVTKLRYADAVVRESLRLHPPGVFSPRQAVRDIELGPASISKNTMILWSPYVAGRLPAVWADPLVFNPDRFAADRSGPGEQPPKGGVDGAWLPFGRGPRACIGFALAQMELTLALARVAQRLDVTLTREGVPKPVGMIVNRPDGGVVATIASRGESVITSV